MDFTDFRSSSSSRLLLKIRLCMFAIALPGRSAYLRGISRNSRVHNIHRMGLLPQGPDRHTLVPKNCSFNLESDYVPASPVQSL